MTHLMTMAQAYSDEAGRLGDAFTGTDGMRAALKALSHSCELSRAVREAGAAHLDLSDDVRADMWMDMGDAFRAMVDQIASSN